MSHDILARVATTDALIDAGLDRASERCIEALANGFARVNVEYLKAFRLTPLYRSGIRYYHNGKLGYDEWVDIATVYKRGVGNCAGLVPIRLAELWMAGERNARPVATIQRLPRDEINWHLFLKRGNGQEEDPSRRLGMR